MRRRKRRTYIVIKYYSLIFYDRRRRQLVFLLCQLPLHVFEKGPSEAWVPLTDAAPESSEGQGTVSHTAEGVRAVFLLIGQRPGEGATERLGPV